MKVLSSILGLASVTSAHTLFTTLFIDGKDQGDGTCVRQPTNLAEATFPIYPVTGDDMACGWNGTSAVNYTCPASGGARLTFEFRIYPNGDQPGAIAEGHKGPCGVYIKKVEDIMTSSGTGDGWFKIWEDGYHNDTQTWCTDTLIANNGLLSVDLPTGLPSGYYLVRPEVLALHNALNGDPQFYTNCAQIFIEDGPDIPLEIPDEYSVSIPGYVNMDTPGLTYNIYAEDLPPYPIPGPEVYIPSSSESGTKQVQKVGVIPDDCLAMNANWCGKPIAKYSTESGCWAAAQVCWDQGDVCWNSVPPSGNAGCYQWNDYCSSMNDACNADDFDGPPTFTAKEVFASAPGPIPSPWNDIFNETNIDGSSVMTTSAAPATTTVAKAATKASSEAAETSQGPVYVSKPIETDAASQTLDTASAETSSSTGLKVSEDGLCGGITGQTCLGSTFGDCCSKKGKCGRKTRHCACGCQAGFGKCRE